MRLYSLRCAVVAVAGLSSVLGVAPAHAQPIPHCTAADLAGIATGVSAATSAYLFTHPPVNDFFTTLRGVPEQDKEAVLTDYMDANPHVAADLRGFRQPLVDFRNRCHGS